MANTVTNTRTVLGRDLVIQQVLIVSDGTEETDLVVFDSSAVATALGKTDPLTCTLLRARVVTQNAATYSTLTLEYDATTDVIAMPSIVPITTGGVNDYDFRDVGGIVNTTKGAAGATGDIVLTTSALDSGDVILLILEVKPY